MLGLGCCLGFSLAVASGGCSPLAVHGLLIAVGWLLLLQSMGSRALRPQDFGTGGLTSRGSWALLHRLNSCGAWAYLLLGL